VLDEQRPVGAFEDGDDTEPFFSCPQREHTDRSIAIERSRLQSLHCSRVDESLVRLKRQSTVARRSLNGDCETYCGAKVKACSSCRCIHSHARQNAIRTVPRDYDGNLFVMLIDNPNTRRNSLCRADKGCEITLASHPIISTQDYDHET
jgi:hypothetical protein